MKELEAIRELTQGLRVEAAEQYGSTMEHVPLLRCAARIEALLPALETAIADKLNDSSAEMRKANNLLLKMEAEIAALKEHERLAVAAALRAAATLAAAEPRVWDAGALPPQQRICAKILALIPPADAKALDTRDAALWLEAMNTAAQYVQAHDNLGNIAAKEILALKREKRGSK